MQHLFVEYLQWDFFSQWGWLTTRTHTLHISFISQKSLTKNQATLIEIHFTCITPVSLTSARSSISFWWWMLWQCGKVCWIIAHFKLLTGVTDVWFLYLPCLTEWGKSWIALISVQISECYCTVMLEVMHVSFSQCLTWLTDSEFSTVIRKTM